MSVDNNIIMALQGGWYAECNISTVYCHLLCLTEPEEIDTEYQLDEVAMQPMATRISIEGTETFFDSLSSPCMHVPK